MKQKTIAIVEIVTVYACMLALGYLLRSRGIVQWEQEHLGWSYMGSLIFIGVPALLLLFTRRNWAEYGVTFYGWQIGLDVGVKAYLVRILPIAFLLAVTLWLRLDYRTFPGGWIVALGEVIGVVVMLIVLRQLQEPKAVSAARSNLITVGLLFLFPILVALLMGRLSLLVMSTVIWQFVFSGFGEEFVWRGYIQTRLNDTFGRPFRWFGVQFGMGLIIASVLFGFSHAFNTYDKNIGIASLSWGWALFTAFGGLLFGILREKTGSLLAPGIAHGLPDAVGEALAKVFGWM
jgi:membrane protease YdiL (CAAX protease family)